MRNRKVRKCRVALDWRSNDKKRQNVSGSISKPVEQTGEAMDRFDVREHGMEWQRLEWRQRSI